MDDSDATTIATSHRGGWIRVYAKVRYNQSPAASESKWRPAWPQPEAQRFVPRRLWGEEWKVQRLALAYGTAPFGSLHGSAPKVVVMAHDSPGTKRLNCGLATAIS